MCVHGALGDFRTWSAVLGPLSKKHRVIAVSLRHFFPEHWDGVGDTYSIAQHVADLIGFIEQLDVKPVDLMGHSRGGHIAFRAAQRRPDLLRKLILVEPGGDLDASLDPAAKPGPSQFTGGFTAVGRENYGRRYRQRDEVFLRHGRRRRRMGAAARSAKAAIARQCVYPGRPGPGQAAALFQADAEQIRMPTLFIGGADTKGLLPQVLHALAAHVPDSRKAMIPGTSHWMFEQAPQLFCEIVLEFLAA